MRMSWLGLSLISAALSASGARAAEVRCSPSEFIVLNPANPSRGYYDLVLQAGGVRASEGEHVNVAALRIDLLMGGRVMESRIVPPADAVRQTRDLAEVPVEGFLDGQILRSGGLSDWFGAKAVLADSDHLGPGQTLLLTRQYFAVNFQPDSLRLTATLVDARGRVKSMSATTPIRAYRSAIRYAFPLKGPWTAQALPVLQGHHRMNASTEFATDFFKLDAEGRATHGDRIDAANWYAWGQEVSAAADGVVVRVISDQTQDRAALRPREGETAEMARARYGKAMMRRIAEQFPASVSGNMVTIRHTANGVVEYSSYGHLEAGSVTVRVGQTVSQGQVIGRVGDTGDTPVVHLHFQINAGPDAFTSQSLPYRFEDAGPVGGDDEVGYVVAPRK